MEQEKMKNLCGLRHIARLNKGNKIVVVRCIHRISLLYT
mgnify:CR=1 FL=1